MTSSLKGWIRVASGLRLVASAATSRMAKEGGTSASNAARHGIDVVWNARTAAAAASASEMWSGLNAAAAADKERGGAVDGYGDRQDVTVSAGVDVGGDGNENVQDGVSKESIVDPIEEATDPMMHQQQFNNEDMTIHPMDTNTNENESKPEDENLITTQPLEDDTITNSPSESQSQSQPESQPLLKEGKPVPSTRLARAMGFASLGISLAAGTTLELASRLVSKPKSTSKNTSAVATDANADRLTQTLCRMRGAALKLGQMLSIQDQTLLPPPLARALQQVRKGADAMPLHQLNQQMEKELGGVEWKQKFVDFEELPFAAASIGQVHRASIHSSDNDGKDDSKRSKRVVVKVQYPGVAESIDSDLSNLQMLVTLTGMVPPGLFIEEVIRVGRKELVVECDYRREMEHQLQMRELVMNDPDLRGEKLVVPNVIPHLSTQRILTSEYCPGGTIDQVAHLCDFTERNRIARAILNLTMKELFVWRFMQTDPNWGNFLYDVQTQTTSLIDFGAARKYEKSFVDGYLRIVWASAERDEKTLMEQSHRMGFLTGKESEVMLEAHKMSGYTVGDPFAVEYQDGYDFASSNITGRIQEHGAVFMQHRLTPPPEEVYTLHRKLAGAYNLCIKLGARIPCRDLLVDVLREYEFEDGLDHPFVKCPPLSLESVQV